MFLIEVNNCEYKSVTELYIHNIQSMHIILNMHMGWYMLSVIVVVAGSRCRCWGTADFPPNLVA